MKYLTLVFVTLLLCVIGQASQVETVSANRTANADTRTAICAASTEVRAIIVTALSTNTETMYVGGDTIDHSALEGIQVDAGKSFVFTAPPGKFLDCLYLYFEVGINTEGLSYTFMK